jgi:hypothetical protein
LAHALNTGFQNGGLFPAWIDDGIKNDGMFDVALILASWARRFGEAAAVKEVVPSIKQAVEHANKIRAYSAAAK